MTLGRIILGPQVTDTVTTADATADVLLLECPIPDNTASIIGLTVEGIGAVDQCYYDSLHAVVRNGATATYLGTDAWGERCKVIASDAADSDYFGYSVALDGDTLAVGAYQNDDGGASSGSVYIYERNLGGADNWGERCKIVASDDAAGDLFGCSVDIQGDTLVVGARAEDGAGTNRGAAYIYYRDEGGADAWGEVVKIVASDTADSDYFGYAVALDGDTAVVGAHLEDGAGTDRGAAYIYYRDTGGADTWGEVVKIIASDTADSDQFGFSVDIFGDTVVVGANLEDGAGTDRGAAYIYERDLGGADTWGERCKITASDTADGDWFGLSVAIDTDTVVVGAKYEGGAGTNRGAVYVFERDLGGADTWGERCKLTASDAANGDEFGSTVGISGDVVVVGAPRVGTERGKAYIYERDLGGADTWGARCGLTASDAADNDSYGNAVATDGSTVIVCANAEDGAGTDRGAAYIYDRDYGGAVGTPDRVDSGSESWDITVDCSGVNLRVRVTGAAATVINWRATADFKLCAESYT